jgi:hypothetical protein
MARSRPTRRPLTARTGRREAIGEVLREAKALEYLRVMAGRTYAAQAEAVVPARGPCAPVLARGPAAILQLQRQIGNAAVVQLLRRDGDYCTCTTTPSRDGYRVETFDYIKKIAPLIKTNAPAADRLAIAGAIADENDTQHGARGLLDWLQDETIGSLTDEEIATDEYFDIHSKLLNALENDIGPANIKLRTGLEYVRSGELVVPGSPKANVKPSVVVAFLQSDEGTVKATAAVIKRAHGIFDDYMEDPSSYNSQAVRVEYFKQGLTYSNRAIGGFDDDPDHVICPGEGGCRFLYNLRKLEDAIK